MNTENLKFNVAKYPELQVPSRLLLGPGPSMVHPQVLHAMSMPSWVTWIPSS